MLDKLEFADIVNLNKGVCNKSKEPFGILNKENILSALSIQDNNYYNSEYLMKAALLRSLVLAHGFEQGNKRTAFLAIVILDTPKCSPAELADLILNIADGSVRDIDKICSILYDEIKTIHDVELEDSALQG